MMSGQILKRVGNHHASVQAANDQYNIDDQRRILNIDETEICIEMMGSGSLRRGIGLRSKDSFAAVAQNSRNVDHAGVMPVIVASEEVYKPIVVFLSKEPIAEALMREVLNVHTHISQILIYFTTNLQVFYGWAEHFLDVILELQDGSHNSLLNYEGLACHVQAEVLKLFKDHRVATSALQSYLSHILQPVDVSCF